MQLHTQKHINLLQYNEWPVLPESARNNFMYRIHRFLGPSRNCRNRVTECSSIRGSGSRDLKWKNMDQNLIFGWKATLPSKPLCVPDLKAAAVALKMAAQTINVGVCPTAARATRPVRARAAAQPARLIGYTGLSKHSLGVAPSECLRTTVASRVAAPASRGQRIVATMAKKSVGDLSKADLEGKKVLVSTTCFLIAICAWKTGSNVCRALLRGYSFVCKVLLESLRTVVIGLPRVRISFGACTPSMTCCIRDVRTKELEAQLFASAGYLALSSGSIYSAVD